MIRRLTSTLYLCLPLTGLVCVSACGVKAPVNQDAAGSRPTAIQQADAAVAMAAQIKLEMDRLEAAVIKAEAGRDVNEPVTGWILASSVPFCFGVYVLAHRLRWFQALKYGSQDRSK